MNPNFPFKLSAAELDRLMARGIVRLQNPELPWQDTPQKAMARLCMARLRAEERGLDVSQFPPRKRAVRRDALTVAERKVRRRIWKAIEHRSRLKKKANKPC